MTMQILAEISDKMPSTFEVLLVVLTALLSAVLVMIGRTTALVVLATAALIGGLYVSAVAVDMFPPGQMHDTIWAELGWPWVIVNVVAPFLPGHPPPVLRAAFGGRPPARLRGQSQFRAAITGHWCVRMPEDIVTAGLVSLQHQKPFATASRRA